MSKMSQQEITDLRSQLIGQAAAELTVPPARPRRQSTVAPAPRDTSKKTPAQRRALAAGPVNPDSIRQTVRTLLLANTTTVDIAKVLQAKFPTSAAAQKATTHIAFYRAQLRRDGLLPRETK